MTLDLNVFYHNCKNNLAFTGCLLIGEFSLVVTYFLSVTSRSCFVVTHWGFYIIRCCLFTQKSYLGQKVLAFAFLSSAQEL